MAGAQTNYRDGSHKLPMCPCLKSHARKPPWPLQMSEPGYPWDALDGSVTEGTEGSTEEDVMSYSRKQGMDSLKWK